MEITRQELTLSVPEAGRRYYGIGKNASYEAAHRGEIPTIKIGKLLRVPVIAMERRLENAGTEASSREGNHAISA